MRRLPDRDVCAGAWAATLLALVVIGLLQDRAHLWLVGATSIVAFLADPVDGVRLSDLTESQKESGAPGILVWRLQYWQQVLALQDDPLLGIGFKEVELSYGREGSSAQRPDPDLRGDGLPRFRGLRLVADHARGPGQLDAREGAAWHSSGLAVAFAASFAGIVLLSFTATVPRNW